jgi:iron(III) transport system permease protein
MAKTEIALQRRIALPLSQWSTLAARILLSAALIVLIVYPLFMVVAAAFFTPLAGGQTLSPADLVTERMATAWWNTLRLGTAVGLFSVFMGGSAALLAAQSTRGGAIDLLMSIPFLTPPFLVSLAWSLAVGPRGYLSRFGLPGALAESLLFSFWGMALIMAGHYAPLVYFAVRAQIAKIPASLLWAARICGASPSQSSANVLLPLLRPALFAGGFLAFASGIEEYGTPLVIGNRIGFPVIATEIGRLVSVYPINLTLASGLASSLLALAGAVYFFSYLLQRGVSVSSGATSRGLPDLLPPPVRALLWMSIAVFAVVVVLIPFAAMLLTSLLKLVSVGPALNNLTLANYLRGLSGGAGGLRDALLSSLALAGFAAAVATLLGIGTARERGVLATVALIPLATPAITMSVGFIRAWNSPWTAWLPIYGSAWIVALFYTAQFLPYAVQYARAGLAAIPPSYEWAARVHGAGGARTLVRIIAPMLWPHSLGGAILIFSIAFRELVGSVLLRPPGMDTVSTFILREFDQGAPAVGMALGMIAVAVALTGVTVARRLAPRPT